MNRSLAKRTSLRLAAAALLCLLLVACTGTEGGAPRKTEPSGKATATLPPIETPLPTPSPTPEPGFVLNETAATIYGGGICQLIAYDEPQMHESRTVTWTSSDASVAVVEEYGVVIGLKKGEALITASANNGTGLTAECRITVTSDRPAPRKAKLYRSAFKNGQEIIRSRLKPLETTIAALQEDEPGDRFALSATRYLGYYYGTEEGKVDCSMMLLYTALDNGLLLPRRSDWQAKALEGHTVDKADLRPGDFLFFGYHEGEQCTCSTRPVCKRYLGIHHAAVYLGQTGDDRYLCDASSALKRVVIRWWDGSDEYADMQLVLCVRPADAG